MQSVILLSVIMLSVAAPIGHPDKSYGDHAKESFSTTLKMLYGYQVKIF
jgi:hypothetical protein